MFRTFFSFLMLLAVNVALAAEYDVLIRNGTVYDGTGAPAYVADLAIKGDRVVAIGNFSESTADLEVDASGLAVAPGFFNMMSHAHLSLLKDGRDISDVLQGVTFEILSEISLSPVNKSTAELWASLFDEEDVELSWSQLGEYLDIVEASGVAPNFGTFVSAATVRMNILGMDDVDPTPEQLDMMKAQVGQAMQDGAFGLTSALIYAPGTYGNVARLLGKYVRDEQVIPMEEAIRRLTLLPAQTLSVSERGRLAPGFFADITIFDPAIIRDHATFEDPHRYSTGVKHVLVNDVSVVTDGEHTGATPGRAVRGPGWVQQKELQQ